MTYTRDPFDTDFCPEPDDLDDLEVARFREITSATGAMNGGQRPWSEVPERSRKLWRARYVATRDFFRETR